MDNLPPLPTAARRARTEKIQAIFEILLLSGILSSTLSGLVFFGMRGKSTATPLNDARIFSLFILLESFITFGLLALILKARHESVFSLGFRWDRWKSHCILGLTLVPFFFLINGLIALIFKVYLPKYFLEENPLTELIRTPQQLVLIIFSALIGGGIKEELQRAFILTRFRLYLGGAGIGLALWSIGFGIGHYVQGVQGIVVATIYGFIFGIAYLMSGSLIAPIVAHSAYDTLVLLAYWFLSGRLK
jgi:membrane protease YdiL (CAAX protease family)